MLTRRALIGTGLSAAGAAGTGAVGGDGAPEAQTSVIDPRQLTEVIRRLETIGDELARANVGPFTGTFPLADKLRDLMTTFLRSQQKFPDFIDVGSGVFLQVYDWHVRNQLALNVGRSPDGRYGIGYLFTRLVLRPDADSTFIGLPYDARV